MSDETESPQSDYAPTLPSDAMRKLLGAQGELGAIECCIMDALRLRHDRTANNAATELEALRAALAAQSAALAAAQEALKPFADDCGHLDGAATIELFPTVAQCRAAAAALAKVAPQGGVKE